MDEIIEILIPGYIPQFYSQPMLLTNILEGIAQPTNLTTDMIIDNEDAIRAKVRAGAKFRFNWINGKVYELPIASASFYDLDQTDILGIIHTMRVVKLQITYMGDISKYQVE